MKNTTLNVVLIITLALLSLSFGCTAKTVQQKNELSTGYYILTDVAQSADGEITTYTEATESLKKVYYLWLDTSLQTITLYAGGRVSSPIYQEVDGGWATNGLQSAMYQPEKFTYRNGITIQGQDNFSITFPFKNYPDSYIFLSWKKVDTQDPQLVQIANTQRKRSQKRYQRIDKMRTIAQKSFAIPLAGVIDSNQHFSIELFSNYLEGYINKYESGRIGFVIEDLREQLLRDGVTAYQLYCKTYKNNWEGSIYAIPEDQYDFEFEQYLLLKYAPEDTLIRETHGGVFYDQRYGELITFYHYYDHERKMHIIAQYRSRDTFRSQFYRKQLDANLKLGAQIATNFYKMFRSMDKANYPRLEGNMAIKDVMNLSSAEFVQHFGHADYNTERYSELRNLLKKRIKFENILANKPQDERIKLDDVTLQLVTDSRTYMAPALARFAQKKAKVGNLSQIFADGHLFLYSDKSKKDTFFPMAVYKDHDMNYAFCNLEKPMHYAQALAVLRFFKPLTLKGYQSYNQQFLRAFQNVQKAGVPVEKVSVGAHDYYIITNEMDLKGIARDDRTVVTSPSFKNIELAEDKSCFIFRQVDSYGDLLRGIITFDGKFSGASYIDIKHNYDNVFLVRRGQLPPYNYKWKVLDLDRKVNLSVYADSIFCFAEGAGYVSETAYGTYKGFVLHNAKGETVFSDKFDTFKIINDHEAILTNHNQKVFVTVHKGKLSFSLE